MICVCDLCVCVCVYLFYILYSMCVCVLFLLVMYFHTMYSVYNMHTVIHIRLAHTKLRILMFVLQAEVEDSLRL